MFFFSLFSLLLFSSTVPKNTTSPRTSKKSIQISFTCPRFLIGPCSYGAPVQPFLSRRTHWSSLTYKRGWLPFTNPLSFPKHSNVFNWDRNFIHSGFAKWSAISIAYPPDATSPAGHLARPMRTHIICLPLEATVPLSILQWLHKPLPPLLMRLHRMKWIMSLFSITHPHTQSLRLPLWLHVYQSPLLPLQSRHPHDIHPPRFSVLCLWIEN